MCPLLRALLLRRTVTNNYRNRPEINKLSVDACRDYWCLCALQLSRNRFKDEGKEMNVWICVVLIWLVETNRNFKKCSFFFFFFGNEYTMKFLGF